MDDYRLVTEVPVRFVDMDALGHVNNAKYLSFLECARVDYLREVMGIVKFQDFGIVVARIEITYKSPAFHHETLLVGCRVTDIGGSAITMSYRIEDKASGRLVAEAESVIVSYNFSRGRPTRVPEEWREKMEKFEGVS